MAKTKEQIRAYNKEYSARPEVKERAKIRNQQFRERRKLYKQTEAGKLADKRYRQSEATIMRIRANRLKSRYNLTPEQVEEMKAKQDNRCAICTKELVNHHIDHDHDTNKVRGLLCSSCNMALGLFKDNTYTMMCAVRYLEQNRAV